MSCGCPSHCFCSVSVRFFVSVTPLLKKMVHIMGARDYSEDGHVSTYNEIELYANCICSHSIHQWHLSLSVCFMLLSINIGLHQLRVYKRRTFRKIHWYWKPSWLCNGEYAQSFIVAVWILDRLSTGLENICIMSVLVCKFINSVQLSNIISI